MVHWRSAWNDPEADVPVIQYARSYAAATDTTSGSEHLVSMTYPAFSRAGTAVSGSNVVNFAYGATGSVDAAGGQITAMSMGSMRIAGFGHTGSGRRASMTLGGTATAPALWTNFGGSTPSANALPGLDSFGRVRDLHYVTNGSGNTTLWRGEHEYDASGNRLWEKLTQRPSDGAVWGTGASQISQAAQGGVNTRSRRFEYDKLERLVASLSGTLDSGHEIAAGGAAYPTIRSEKWKLDKLGNWSGDSEPATLIDLCSWSQVGQPPYPGIPGGPGSPPGNQQPVPGIGGNGFLPGHSVVFGEDEETEERKVWEAHLVASGITQDATTAQALTSIQPNAIDQVYDFGGGTFRHEQHRTDPCGNLVLDDRYYYQYDAWNRLCSVREKGTLSYFRLDKYGVPQRLEGQDTTPLASYPTTCEWPSIGKLIKNFTYDGVGRLARTSSPVEAPEGWEFEEIEGGPSSAPDPWFTRSERFIYDGVRRIQEIVTDPILSDGESNRVATMSFEHEQRNGGHGGEAGALPTINVFLRAQYVWGPGDNGVDELLCQIDPYAQESHAGSGGPQGKPWYILTDAQGDVVSMVGVTQDLASGTPIASVAGQWTYSPYGEVLTYEQFHPHPALVYGHKTLRVDRLDGEALTWEYDGEDPESMAATGTFFETRRLEPGARLVSYARNRTLDTKRGRWLQLDPNASGASVTGSLAYHGSAPEFPAMVSLASRTTDGVNLYQYALSGPVMRDDRLGLYSVEEFGEDFFNSSFGMPGVSDFLGGALSAMVETYAANQEWDVDWASDWSQGDGWSTRNDNSWVLESAVQGIYDSFEIGWGDYKANPLDGLRELNAGAGNPASTPGSKNALAKALQDHHIASNKGSNKALFEIEFKKAGMTLDDPANRVRIPHGGRHSREYNDYVLDRVKKAVQAKSQADAKVALTAELKSLKDFIKRNPHFVYNSAGGKPTGWKGMREHFTVKRGGKYRYKGPR